jgi:hypothetical protein
VRGHRLLALASLVLASLALSCRHGSDLRTLDARTLRVVTFDDAPVMRATYFPSTAPRARRREAPLVVVEPLLFQRTLLYASEGGGLVGYFQREGFNVWLVGFSSSPPEGPRALGGGIVRMVTSIAKETGIRQIDLLGLSLGAEGALRALEPLMAAGSPVTVHRVVFLGGGFDFAYPHSFASRIASVRGGPATTLCTLDGDVDCARDFRRPGDAVPWLASLPPADGDALAPARERFPFVAHFTRLPVLFVNGKADGIAPSESMFPLYTLWGSDEPNPRAVPKLLFLAGRENALGWDFDDFELLAGPHAERVWSHLVGWLKRDD